MPPVGEVPGSTGRRADGVAGLLLTGGSSRRMGFDKASFRVGGVPNAVRLGALLAGLVEPVLEVGPGVSGLAAVSEEPAGSGPLAALWAGGLALQRSGHAGPALVLACDLPFVGREVLEFLRAWPGGESVVPLVRGRAQPLCARWSAAELVAAGELVEAGERSMRVLLSRPGVALVGEEGWPGGVSARDFEDFDSPADLSRLGLS